MELMCLHNITNYNIILWYKTSARLTLELMGYLWNKKEHTEANFTQKIEMIGDANKDGSLIFKKLSVDDSAVYFCAASYHCGTNHCTSAQKLSL